MPLVEITLVEGRSAEQLRALISAVTRACVESIDAPLGSVRVVLREVPPSHFAAGDVTIAERLANDSRTGTSINPPDLQPDPR